MPIIHSPSPPAPTQPTGPAQWPRSPASLRRMNPSASARGVPPTAGVGCRRSRSSSTPTGMAEPALDPRAEMGHRAEGDERGLVGHRQLVAVGRESGGDLVDHVAVLRTVLAGPGQVALGVGIGAGGVAPGARCPPRGGMTPGRRGRPPGSSGLAPKKVPSGTGMEKMVQLGSPARSRRSTAARCSGPSSCTVTGRDRTTLRSVAPGSRMCATASATMCAVGRRGHGSGQIGDARVGGDVGRRAVLPDDGVEELVGPGQRGVGGPDRGGPAPGDAVGVAGDPHGEAGDHEVPGHGVDEGQRTEGHGDPTRGSARRRRTGSPPGPRPPPWPRRAVRCPSRPASARGGRRARSGCRRTAGRRARTRVARCARGAPAVTGCRRGWRPRAG